MNEQPAGFIETILADPKFASALIAGIVAVTVFVLARVWEVCQAFYVMYTTKRRLIVALHTEIQHNLDEFQETLDESPKVDDSIRAVFENNPDKLVHAPYSRNMRFFDDLRRELYVLPPQILDPTVRFYHTVESIYALADGFGSESFRNLTPDAKMRQLEEFTELHTKAIEKGEAARDALKDAYPRFIG